MKSRLADPSLRRDVEAAVRRRVRGEDAEDVVQATLTDVLAASRVPEAEDEFRRFVFGVARNKVFDHFRRQRRQAEGLDENETAGPEAPLSERDILRWAEGELPDSESKHTLEWMLREGDGEKLEHIARDAKLPATRVRQRVSRLRRLLRQRWAAELTLAGLAVLLCAGGAYYWLSRDKQPQDVVEKEIISPVPSVQREPAPSRPAGSASELPAPQRSAAPESSAAPAPSAAPLPSTVPSAAPSAQPSPKSKLEPTLPKPKPFVPKRSMASSNAFDSWSDPPSESKK
jgi:RNA polymerase sigma factor (sigma-70 family)